MSAFEPATSSFSYEKPGDDSLRLLVEQSKADQDARVIDMIVKEGRSIWHAAFKVGDLPTVSGQSGLEARHLFRYLRDGKDEKDGCSLDLSKVGDSYIVLSIEENRGKRRPPAVMRFRMAECKKEDKISLLERVFVSMRKENMALTQIVDEQLPKLHVYQSLFSPLDNWTLSMSCEDRRYSNSKQALTNFDVTDGAMTTSGGKQTCQWIQATFPMTVAIKGFVLGNLEGHLFCHCDNYYPYYFEFLDGDGLWKSPKEIKFEVIEEKNVIRYYSCSVTAQTFRFSVTNSRKSRSRVGTSILIFL